jgi:hypothetical protein
MENLFSVMQQTLTQPDKNSLLKNQQLNQETINNLIEKASEMTSICGPSCQKTKVSQELEQKYLDAQTNMQTAPENLERARKNYYIFSKGRTEYDNINEKELQIKATQISETIEQNFNDGVTNANTINTLLNTALINSQHTIRLFEDLSERNKVLKLKVKEIHGDILTNSRKTYYQTEALDRLELWYKFFLTVFYIIVIMLCLSFVFAPHNLSAKKCIVISILIIFYPLYINYIVIWICGLWKSLKKRIPKNVYNDL